MIKNTTFTQEWIQQISNTYTRGKRKASPALIEKATKALHLLDSLAATDFQFIFKGGTALLLLLDEMHRFSIDIDITTTRNLESLDSIFSQIVADSEVFNRYEEDIRSSNISIQKRHIKFFYNSILDGSENYILLDILNVETKYSNIIQKEVNCRLIDFVKPSRYVQIPDTESLLGDKLTAFAPNTTGIPYGVGKELEIIKQLFDIAQLFDSIQRIDTVSESFKMIAQQELEFRGKHTQYSYQDVLIDIFNTSLIIGERNRMEKETFNLLLSGIKTIRDYIFTRNFILESAVNCAAKAAYLSKVILFGKREIDKFDSKIDLSQYRIKNPEYKKFSSILKFDPEAYYYWFKTFELMEQN